jgi:hypothetical protein
MQPMVRGPIDAVELLDEAGLLLPVEPEHPLPMDS